MLDQQQYETLLNILQGNERLAKIIKDSVASDGQLERFIVDITNNPKKLVGAILQNNGEVVKGFIDLIASNDQLKDFIINSIDGEKNKALVGVVLKNNGEMAKRAIDLVASDDQLKNAICKNPEKEVKKIMDVIMRAINDIENGEKPLTFLDKLNEHKGKIAISVLLTGGAVTAFILEQPVIGAIAAVAAVIMVGILIREICKQQSATQESTLENTVRSVLNGTTLNPAAQRSL